MIYYLLIEVRKKEPFTVFFLNTIVVWKINQRTSSKISFEKISAPNSRDPTFLVSNHIKVLDWPGNIFDPNTTENL